MLRENRPAKRRKRSPPEDATAAVGLARREACLRWEAAREKRTGDGGGGEVEVVDLSVEETTSANSGTVVDLSVEEATSANSGTTQPRPGGADTSNDEALARALALSYGGALHHPKDKSNDAALARALMHQEVGRAGRARMPPPGKATPFGTFNGGTFYRNVIHPSRDVHGENGFVSLPGLVPQGCPSALTVTFCGNGDSSDWHQRMFGGGHQRMFGGHGGRVQKMVTVEHDESKNIGRNGKPEGPRVYKIGTPGVCQWPDRDPKDRDWLRVKVAPGAGILHCKLLLFSSGARSGGLRVVVSGNNVMASKGTL